MDYLVWLLKFIRLSVLFKSIWGYHFWIFKKSICFQCFSLEVFGRNFKWPFQKSFNVTLFCMRCIYSVCGVLLYTMVCQFVCKQDTTNRSYWATNWSYFLVSVYNKCIWGPQSLGTSSQVNLMFTQSIPVGMGKSCLILQTLHLSFRRLPQYYAHITTAHSHLSKLQWNVYLMFADPFLHSQCQPKRLVGLVNKSKMKKSCQSGRHVAGVSVWRKCNEEVWNSTFLHFNLWILICGRKRKW